MLLLLLTSLVESLCFLLYNCPGWVAGKSNVLLDNNVDASTRTSISRGLNLDPRGEAEGAQYGPPATLS